MCVSFAHNKERVVSNAIYIDKDKQRTGEHEANLGNRVANLYDDYY